MRAEYPQSGGLYLAQEPFGRPFPFVLSRTQIYTGKMYTLFQLEHNEILLCLNGALFVFWSFRLNQIVYGKDRTLEHYGLHRIDD